MSRLAIVGAVTILIAAAPVPALAQAAVSEPGMVSFYRPNADILHEGPRAHGPPVYGSPYDAQAYAGGPVVVQDAYPYQRPGATVRHHSRSYQPQ